MRICLLYTSLPAPEKEVDALYVFTEDTFKVWVDSVFEAKGGFNPTDRSHRMVKELSLIHI